jgi:fido (protein-threonine AMPylation protein)
VTTSTIQLDHGAKYVVNNTTTHGTSRFRGSELIEQSLNGRTPTAYFLGELNAAHPFREGNGRTQREFLREPGLMAAHYIDWRAMTAQEMIEALQLSHRGGDSSLLTKMILKCMPSA